jgi:hypothetical protein
MADFLVAAGTTQNTRISMSGADTLTVEATGTLSVSGNNQSVRFNGVTTNGVITNSGTIENTAVDGRAIRIENAAGATPVVTITNNATGIVQSNDDAIQIQAGVVTGGTVGLTNSGTITSTLGQALDFAGGAVNAAQNVDNSGSITSAENDSIRIGGTGTISNTGTINGGAAATYAGNVDGIQFEDSSSGSVTNNGSGAISGDRHGVNGGLNTTVTVTNAINATITGRNGSGVGLDGTGIITNFGTITGSFSNSAGSDINGTTVGLPNGGGPDGINDGDGDGIDVDGQATIDNHGTIQGTGAGGSGSDGRLNTSEGIAAGGGTIRNFAGATISGIGLGILIDDSSTGPAPFVTTVENAGTISGGTSFAIRIIGTQNDTIQNSGTISGGGGVAIQLGDGNDTLSILLGSSITGTSQGEGGTDLLNYSGYTANATANLTSGAATGTGGISGFESITGGSGSDTLGGNSGINTIDGGAGNDKLIGAAGNDILNGSADDDRLIGGVGADAMSGGTGNDTYFVDNTGDTTDETGGSGVDTVYSTISHTLAAGVEKLYLDGTGNINGTGNTLVNYLFGNSGNNILDGAGGADRMFGGAGDDTFIVDSAGDRAFETTAGVAGGTDTVQTAVNFTMPENIENLVITSVAGLVSVIGNSLGNTMTGSAGNSFIDGRGGLDTLTGGLGDDNFVFSTTLSAGNVDTITDFSAAQDEIWIDNAIFAGLANGSLATTAFHTGAVATTAAHRIIYNSATGEAFYDSDGTGASGQVLFAALTTLPALTETNFFVY